MVPHVQIFQQQRMFINFLMTHALMMHACSTRQSIVKNFKYVFQGEFLSLVRHIASWRFWNSSHQPCNKTCRKILPVWILPTCFMLVELLLRQIFQRLHVMIVIIIGVIHNHTSNLIFPIAKMLKINTFPTQMHTQDLVPSILVKKIWEVRSFKTCRNEFLVPLALPYDHIKTKAKNYLTGWLRRWIVDRNYLRIHPHNLLPCLSLSVCCVQIRSMLVMKWLSNLYSFSCHHPTIATAAAKQRQNITLLIIMEPKGLFTKATFTQQVVIFSFQFSFILYLFLGFIKIWNWDIMPFTLASSRLWLVNT